MGPIDFLARAARDAALSIRRGEGGPFGAVITRKSRVVAVAHNTVLKHKDPTCHAEINAIRIACRKLKRIFLQDCEIFSTTEPCPMCFSAVHWARLKQVTYSTTIPEVRKLGFNELAIPSPKMKGLGRSPVRIKRIDSRECRALLKAWMDLPTKKTY